MKFKGNFLTSLPANHSVIFSEPYMVSKGIGSWNRDSFKQAISSDNSKQLKEALTEYQTGEDYWAAINSVGGNVFALPEAIARECGYVYQNGWTCTHWSDANGENVRKYYEASYLFQLLKYHEEGGEGNGTYDRELKRIKSSVNSCVVYGFGESAPKTVTVAGKKVHQEPWKYTAKLFIRDINENSVPNAEDERVLIPKHSDKTVMAPKLPTGKSISYKASMEHHTAVDSAGNTQTGVSYKKVAQGKDSNDDMIAAGIDYYYDNNTGKYFSGTVQIIAILMEDLPSANIKSPNIKIENLKEDSFSKPEKWYTKSGEYYSGNFTTATAVPISMEDGNPNTYGPDITLCDGNREIDKVRAVNRSNNKYDAGQQVMLNKINGEWIVSDFGTLESTPSVAKIGRWGFQQYMANSDVLFRNGNAGRLGPEDAQDLALFRCWDTYSGNARMKSMNARKYDNVVQGSNQKFLKYAQCSSFDYKRQIAKNPIALQEESGLDIYDLSMGTFFGWWGACFQQGYTGASVKDWDGASPVAYGGEAKYIDITNTPLFHRTAYTATVGTDGSSKKYQSPKAPHCPADIALNSPLGSNYGVPLFSTNNYISKLNSGGDVSALFSTMCNSSPSSRSDIGYWKNQDGSELALKPANNQSLVFMPLGMVTALGDDSNTNVQKSVAGSNIVDQYINNGSEFRYWRDKLFNNVFGSAPFGSIHKYAARNDYSGQPDLSQTGSIGSNGDGFFKPGSTVSNSCIPYGPYLKRDMLSKPLGAIAFFENMGDSHIGPGVVGITAARVRVGRRDGGVLNVNTGGMFGRIGNRRAGGVQKVSFQGILTAVFGGNTSYSGGLPASTGYRATWGASQDKIFSFGGFNIFSMAWDYWPESHTIFIPEYFTVLHFNEGIAGSEPTQDDAGFDEITYPNVDFREPTIQPLGDNDGDAATSPPPELAAIGTRITYSTSLLGAGESKVSTIRRGICVTNGYHYPKRTVGLSDEYTIKSAGTEFAAGDVLDVDKGAKIVVTAVDNDGGITGFEFNTVTVGGTDFKERGEGFTGDMFPKGDPTTEPPIPDGRLFYVTPTRPGGENCTILWRSGTVYEKDMYEEGVQRRDGLTTPQLVSPGSGDGSNTVGDRWSVFDDVKQIQLNPNGSTGGQKDEYEVFFFVVNDVDIVNEQHGVGATIYDRFNGITIPQISYMTMDLS